MNKTYVVLVDEWREVTKIREFDGAVVGWKDHKRGDLVELDPESDDVLRLGGEAGALREATDEDREAAAAAAAPAAPVEEPGSEGPPVTESGDSYDDPGQWSFDDLKSLAEDRDLSKGGSRADIVERLRAFDADNA